jgi:hypothetical protein
MKGLSVLLTLALLLLAHRLSVCLRPAGALPTYAGRPTPHQLDRAQIQTEMKPNFRPLRVEVVPQLRASHSRNLWLGGSSNPALPTLEF